MVVVGPEDPLVKGIYAIFNDDKQAIYRYWTLKK
jgi:phosphoribosylamine-glycine ligase